jgi:hypothetical protein
VSACRARHSNFNIDLSATAFLLINHIKKSLFKKKEKTEISFLQYNEEVFVNILDMINLIEMY